MVAASKLTLPLILLICMIVPNCGTHVNQNPLQVFLESPQVNIQEKDEDAVLYADYKKLYDIFIPESAILHNLTKENDSRNITISFTSGCKLEDEIAQYRTEMDFLGWEEFAIFEDSIEKCCLIFVRPSKVCIVLFQRNNKSDYTITLFIGPRKLVNEA